MNYSQSLMRSLEAKIFQIIPFVLLSVVVGCSNTNFSPASSATAPDSNQVVPPTPGNPCTPVADITRLTKILFVVDTSGSNNSWSDSTGQEACSNLNNAGCLPPTDPQKNFRYNSIENFLTQYSKKSNFQWGLMTFSNSQSVDFVSQVQGGASFTNSVGQMQAALNAFQTGKDNGDTPYRMALSSAEKAILKDADNNQTSNVQYYVILLSDGYPTDIGSADGAHEVIKSLVSAGPAKSVSLSAIYYGSQSAMAAAGPIQMLSSLAQLGGGQFANVTNASRGIDISDVIPGHTCP